jgi:hypothetical protein
VLQLFIRHQGQVSSRPRQPLKDLQGIAKAHGRSCLSHVTAPHVTQRVVIADAAGEGILEGIGSHLGQRVPSWQQSGQTCTTGSKNGVHKMKA